MVPVEPSDGWSASTYDTNKLMRVFDTLWVKAGFALHAYAFRAGSNGNGIRWSGVPIPLPDCSSARATKAVMQPVFSPSGA